MQDALRNVISCDPVTESTPYLVGCILAPPEDPVADLVMVATANAQAAAQPSVPAGLKLCYNYPNCPLSYELLDVHPVHRPIVMGNNHNTIF